MSLEKTIYIGSLFSIYKPLLTEKQQEMLSLYYEEDFSLSEIADQFGISRQGVRDNIRRGENQLQNYEAALSMHANRIKRLSLLDELQAQVDEPNLRRLIEQLKQIEE
ncbi:YlxM family DNA-binding protein [Fundicoccus culcitae]|uniref:UPF0122 protein NRE15_00065 n=1 Tax=Fundicoccus culcitae TaxID=2969821 RepID=A0ABY5P5W0_9LACT|nr:YlxM family DNA-binding protein [Fundicoccus culcitae]UUX34101.1 YlxM family DNA-binding protein [Fundicoccus culcitae]